MRKEKGLSVAESMKAAGVAWNALAADAKEKFNQKANEDLER